MKDIFKRLKKDNKGAAMAMVLVIIMFISILAAVLMFVSYLGYQMRLMNKSGTDTFYTAETVLDEINTGLQVEASEAMAAAYNDLMQNYAVYDSAVMRSSQLYRAYIDELQSRLQGSGPVGTYDVGLLRSWLSDDVVGNSDVPDVSDRTNTKRASRDKFGTWGAIVEANVGNDETDPTNYQLVKKEGESLLLRDLKVTYVDRTGYVSIISTDIRLVLPTVSFAQSSELPRLEKFSLIADETLAMGNHNAGGIITIKGNAYGGRMSVGKTDENPSFLSGSVVTFASATGADAENMSLVISRENVEVNDSILTTDNVEFWGENILLSGSDIRLDGITNLKDDLVLDGNGSTAQLIGEYNGFSMLGAASSSSPSGGGSGDDEDSAEDDSTNPALSSAIVVNGQNSSLDLSGLESMTIAGRSYVQTKASATDPEAVVNQNKSNIMMAESVAVKSNQIVYLVPSEAIGCVIENDGTIGDTAYGANPLSLEQYEEIVNNPDKYVLLDGKRQIAALGYKPLSTYIDQVQVAGQAQMLYMPEVIFKQTNNGTLVYCYMRFTDEEKANQYFRDYYDVNTDQIDKYTRLYAKEIKMPDPEAMLYLNLAGNMLVYDDGQTTPASVISAPGDSNTSYYIRQKQAETIFNTKTNAFKALSSKLVTNIADLSVIEQSRNAFDNIINRGKLDDMIAAAPSGTLEIETGADSSKNKAIFTRDAMYTVNASTPQSSIIVSTGDVQVVSDYKGLIIAAGNIYVESSGAPVEITPMELSDFSQILNGEIEISGIKYYVMDAFRDGIHYKSGDTSSGGSDATQTVALVDLIVYEQWTMK